MPLDMQNRRRRPSPVVARSQRVGFGAEAGVFLELWRRGLIEGRLCGCGLPVRDCDVWTGVLDRAYPAGVDAHELLRLAGHSARTRHLPLHLVNRNPGGEEYRNRLGSLYRSGRSPHWVKVKNPKAPAVKREAEEDWSR